MNFDSNLLIWIVLEKPFNLNANFLRCMLSLSKSGISIIFGMHLLIYYVLIYEFEFKVRFGNLELKVH